jgi:hypothetical protein
MRSEGGVMNTLPDLKNETWGTRCISDAKIGSGFSEACCASLRGRSGWRWDLFSI